MKMKEWLLGNRSRIGDWYITLYIWIYKVEEYDNSDAQIRCKTLISATEKNNMEIILVSRRMCQKTTVWSFIACLRGLWEVDDARVESDMVLSAVTQSMDVSVTFSAENTHTCFTRPASVWLWIMTKIPVTAW